MNVDNSLNMKFLLVPAIPDSANKWKLVDNGFGDSFEHIHCFRRIRGFLGSLTLV